MNKSKGLWILVISFVLAFALMGEAKQVQAEECQHEYDYECDAYCNLCGEHRNTYHVYNKECYDAKYSWKECECGKPDSDYQEHYFPNDTYTKCEWCGYERELVHNFVTQKSDELYHWKICECGAETEKELHVYSGENCLVCGYEKPDWYDESKHRFREGVEYLSLQEAAMYMKIQFAQRNIGMQINYYCETDKMLEAGNMHRALYEEMCVYNGVATEGDLLWDLWNARWREEEYREGEFCYSQTTDWVPRYPTTLEQEQWLAEEIARIFEELQIDKMTDYEKIYAIFHYVCEHISYGWETNAYWALKTGYAVCDGYADLIYRMMVEAGIETRIIGSKSHGWNIVRLGDVFYCLDATWDAGKDSKDYQYFLCGLSENRLYQWDHYEYPEYHSEAFFAECPVSHTSYGKTLPEAGVDGSVNDITWSLSDDGVLEIKGSGEICPGLLNYWRGFIKKIVIGEGITEIGDSAFSCCTALEEVIIPDSVTRIEASAFAYCDSLRSIVLPKKLNYLGGGVFQGCSRLTEVVLPDSVEYLGEEAFGGCIGLERVVLSKNMKKIERETFWRCENLRTVIIPEGIEELAEEAFWGAFSYKESSITLPKSVTKVGTNCFWEAKVTELIWNASTEMIYDNGCRENRALKHLVVGNSVKELGDYAFAFCSGLTTVDLPESLEQVGTYVFAWCDSLEEIVIPGGLKTVGKSMFYNCVSLRKVTFSEGVTTIGELAFDSCTSLATVIIPEWIKQIDELAFGWCEGLNKIVFEGDAPEVLGDPGSIPFHQVWGVVYYNPDKDGWTPEKRKQFTHEWTTTWIAMHGENEEHSKVNEWRCDEFGHWHYCTGCDAELDKQEHVFDSAEAASCNVCDYCALWKGVHRYTKERYNEEYHWKECECGARENYGKHTFENVCYETVCHNCGYFREEEHNYSKLRYDSDGHWYECSRCGSAEEKQRHEYSLKCDEDCDVCGKTRTVEHTYDSSCDTECNVCGKTRTASHTYETKWTEELHWQECSCGHKANEKEHSWQTECDTSCNECGYTREITHDYSAQKSDEDSHWLECTCGEKDSIEAHSWDGGTQNGRNMEYICGICGKTKTEEIPATPTPTLTVAPTATPTSEPVATATSAPTQTSTITPSDSGPVAADSDGGNNLIGIIAAVAVVAVIGGGAGIGFAIKKKRG